MQDVHVKLNPGLPQQNHHSTRKLLSPADCSKVLHLGHSILWCWRRMGKIFWTDCV